MPKIQTGPEEILPRQRVASLIQKLNTRRNVGWLIEDLGGLRIGGDNAHKRGHDENEQG